MDQSWPSKIIHLRLLLPAAERRRAPEMAEGDQWCPPRPPCTMHPYTAYIYMYIYTCLYR